MSRIRHKPAAIGTFCIAPVPPRFVASHDSYLTITTSQPEVKHVVHRSLLVLIFSGMILTLVGVVCRSGTILSRIACSLVSVAIVMSCCAGAIHNLAPWHYGPPVQGPNGQIYYVM